jgi:hypothetical protein
VPGAQGLCAQDFELIFGRRWEAAANHVLQVAPRWCGRLHDLGADPASLVPVVFPELLRRSLIRSGAERLGLGTLYVARGRGAADFSVGVFQMKPSFVEDLETASAALATAPTDVRSIGEYPGIESEWQRRAERLRRLQTEDWQLRYLACFYLVEAGRFGIDGLSIPERVGFLSAAYNHGFLRPREEIEAARFLRLFPGGGRPGMSSPYRYCDVAVDFYERLWRLVTEP